jgi:hypothetical protein
MSTILWVSARVSNRRSWNGEVRSREEGFHSCLKTTVKPRGRASGGGRRKERNGGIKKRHEA